MNDFAPYATEYEAIEAYEDMLNDCYGTVDICGISYDAGRAFKNADPIAFRCGFNDWLDGVQEDMDDEDEESEATAYCLTCGQDNDEPHTDTAHTPNWVEYE